MLALIKHYKPNSNLLSVVHIRPAYAYANYMAINSSLYLPFQVHLIVQERALFNKHFRWHRRHVSFHRRPPIQKPKLCTLGGGDFNLPDINWHDCTIQGHSYHMRCIKTLIGFTDIDRRFLDMLLTTHTYGTNTHNSNQTKQYT